MVIELHSLSLETLSWASDRPPYDNAVVSGQYSTLSGVLAGFAFTALVMLVGQRNRDGSVPADRSTKHGIGFMLAAFIGLGSSSLSYAVMAGDSSTVRLAATHVVAGCGLVAATLLLLVGINEVLAPLDLTWVELLTTRLLPS